MSNQTSDRQDAPLPGRLAQVIASRGGLAPPEAPFVIEHREALIYMLCEAAELEHGIMCQYLYAAFSLKQSQAEGLTAAEEEAVNRWRKQISHVATQEMLHLSLVQNLLSAIGAAPHLSRPNFPQPARHYPAGVHLALIPFGEAALRHFMFLERPEGMDIEDAAGMTAFRRAAPAVQHGEIVPRGQDFATVGHLYRSIEAGIARLAEKFGERALFVGPPRAQATQADFRLARTGRGDRRGLGPAGHRRDPRAGRGAPRALAERALRPVRGHPGRVRPAPRGQPGLQPGPPGGPGQRQGGRARHRRPAGRRPGDRAGDGRLQRLLRDLAADAAAVLRPHRGDRLRSSRRWPTRPSG